MVTSASAPIRIQGLSEIVRRGQILSLVLAFSMNIAEQAIWFRFTRRHRSLGRKKSAQLGVDGGRYKQSADRLQS